MHKTEMVLENEIQNLGGMLDKKTIPQRTLQGQILFQLKIEKNWSSVGLFIPQYHRVN